MYLYIFKNKTTNKKYLGYTESNIESYLGSGKYWKNHCATHGGYCNSNIEKIWYQWFDDKNIALKWLKDFEQQNPDYWKNENWCNLIPENLEKSPFKDNMDIIFEKNGNPFTGGNIQRKAHHEGKHNYDHSESAKLGWKKRNKIKAVDKMTNGYQKWITDNKDYFLLEQRRKLQLAKEARKLNLQKLEYDGKIYYGWTELQNATNKTKYFLKKDPMVIIL
jgi:hypothetical protein